METVNPFTCSICNEVSVIGQDNKILYIYGCKKAIHKRAEESAPSAGSFKCQICNRIELKARDGSYYQGCNIFKRHQELGIVGFHDSCFRTFASKLMKSELKGQ